MSELKATSLSHKDNNTGTPNITMYPDGTTSIGLTHTGGFKNHLINADFRVKQRGDSFTTSNNIYTADRWFITGTSTTNPVEVDFSSTAPDGFDESIRVRNGDFNALQQGIELQSTNAAPFAEGSQWTLSVWCNKVPTGAFFRWRSRVGDDEDQATAANFTSWTAGETNGSFTRYNTTVTILATRPSATQICLNIAILLDSTLGSTNLAGVQFEPGPTATEFEHRPIGTELALCQRYFEEVAIKGTLLNVASSTGSSCPLICQCSPKRAVPSVVDRTTLNIQEYVGDTPTLPMTISSLSYEAGWRGVILNMTRKSSTAAQKLYFVSTNSIQLDAEL